MSHFAHFRPHLTRLTREKARNGFAVEGLVAQIETLPESLDAAFEFIQCLANAPLRSDWGYVEPDTLAEIHAESSPARALSPLVTVSPAESAQRVETAFLASVCGCILGKPIEFNPTLPDLERIFSEQGDWPLRDYVSERVEPGIIAQHGGPMPYWNNTYREGIRFVMPDDDLNYSILGMLLLEAWGTELTTDHVRQAWATHLPPTATCGPEQTALGLLALEESYARLPFYRDLMSLLSGGDFRGEAHCGAQIRADAYGYACPGNPALAADLAFQDAVLTHRGTGLYATMWTSAAIAVAQTSPQDPLDIFRTANEYIPQKSRFHEAVTTGLELVADAPDWRSGYEAIHARLGGERGSHCGVYEESATLINTLKFARRVDEGICLQVMQGNDTDSYGATAGSLLGAFLGPGTLDETRWLAPFQDTIHTALAWFYEPSLSAVARRMANLPRHLAENKPTGTTKG